MKYLFLDTNIYIHYIDFEQIDWNRILKLDKHDQITVVIPSIIMDEIDNLKDKESNARRKKKAKTISAKISDFLLFDKKGKFQVTGCTDPGQDLFSLHNMDKEKNDDVFLLSALQFQEENEAEVIIISSDNRVLYKAKQLKLPFHLLGDNLLLKEEPTKEEKEILELKSKLSKYENRRSEPLLSFNRRDILIKLNKIEHVDIAGLIDKRIEEEKAKYKYWSIEELQEKKQRRTIGSSFPDLSEIVSFDINFLGVSDQDITLYNKEIDEYLDDYRIYITHLTQFEVMSSMMYDLKLYLYNKGTSPSGNITLFIEFPQNINLYNSQNIDYKYFDPPIKPRESPGTLDTRAHRISQKKIANISQSILSRGQTNEQANPFWNLTKEAPNFYQISMEPLSHGLVKEVFLNNLYLDLRGCSNFNIQYKIIDDSLIDPVQGNLSVVIE